EQLSLISHPNGLAERRNAIRALSGLVADNSIGDRPLSHLFIMLRDGANELLRLEHGISSRLGVKRGWVRASNSADQELRCAVQVFLLRDLDYATNNFVTEMLAVHKSSAGRDSGLL